jgi:hypothetical protein
VGGQGSMARESALRATPAPDRESEPEDPHAARTVDPASPSVVGPEEDEIDAPSRSRYDFLT